MLVVDFFALCNAVGMPVL